MRRQPAPHHLAGQTERVEELGIIAGDTAAKHVRLPRRRGDLVALKLFQDLQRAVHAVQLCPRSEMLPPKEEPHEVGGRHRFDLTA